MIQFITNVVEKTGSEVGTVYYLNAFLFENGNLITQRNNVLINKEQLAELKQFEWVIKNSQTFTVTSKKIVQFLDEIATYNSVAHITNAITEEIKKVCMNFKTLDKNYGIQSVLTYKGIPIPESVVEIMMKAKTKEESLAIHRFYLKCLSNLNPESVKDLFKFIEKSKLLITPSGNFVTFRRVLTVQKAMTPYLFHKISSAFSQAIFNKKDASKEFYKIEENLLLPSTEEEGKSILELHNSIVTSEARFTDNHSKKFDYRIGKNYREKNYDSNHYNLCSKGLHSGSFDYIESMRLGDQIVYCIVNPMNVVAVADNATKVRSSELFIAGAIEESNWLDFKGKLENGVINFDNVDEQFEKNYEGLTIEYNSVDSTKPRERHILSEDELEEEKDDYDYELDDEEDYDQDEEDLRDELMDSIKESEEILKTYAEKVERFKRMLNERC